MNCRALWIAALPPQGPNSPRSRRPCWTGGLLNHFRVRRSVGEARLSESQLHLHRAHRALSGRDREGMRNL